MYSKPRKSQPLRDSRRRTTRSHNVTLDRDSLIVIVFGALTVGMFLGMYIEMSR